MGRSGGREGERSKGTREEGKNVAHGVMAYRAGGPERAQRAPQCPVSRFLDVIRGSGEGFPSPALLRLL